MSEKKVFECPVLLTKLPSLPSSTRIMGLQDRFRHLGASMGARLPQLKHQLVTSWVTSRRMWGPRVPGLKDKLMVMGQYWWMLPLLLAAGLVLAGKFSGHRGHPEAPAPQMASSEEAESADCGTGDATAAPVPHASASEPAAAVQAPVIDDPAITLVGHAESMEMPVPPTVQTADAPAPEIAPDLHSLESVPSAAPVAVDTESVHAENEQHEAHAAVCLKGHSEVVTCAVFVPGKPWVLSASHDQTLRLWDVRTGQEVRRIAGRATQVHCLAVTHDGRRALSGSGRFEMRDGKLAPVDCVIRLWDLQTGQELRRYAGHDAPLTSVALSPDDRYFLSASHDRTVRLWDLDSGRVLRKLEGHGSGVQSVCFSVDGHSALSAGGADRSIRVWDLSSGHQLQCLHQAGPVKCVVALPDGRHILSAGGEMNRLNLTSTSAVDFAVHLWDLRVGREVHRFEGHDRPIMSLAVCADGRHLVSGGLDGSVRLWDLTDGRQIQCLDAHTDWVWSVATSTDGRLALSASGDRSIKVWNMP